MDISCYEENASYGFTPLTHVQQLLGLVILIYLHDLEDNAQLYIRSYKY